MNKNVSLEFELHARRRTILIKPPQFNRHLTGRNRVTNYGQ